MRKDSQMIPKLVKLQNVDGIAGNGRPIVNLPRANIYHGLFLLCRTSAGVLLTEAEIEADITNIRVRVDGDLKVETTAAVLFDLYRYWYAMNGAYTIAGQIPILFVRPNLQFAAERSLLAWGMDGIESFNLELDLAATLAKVATIQIWALQEVGKRALGRHLCIGKHPRIFGSTGVQQVSDIPYGDVDNLILADHITVGSGAISDVTVRLNQSDVWQELQNDLNKLVLNCVGRTAQTGYFHLDFAQFNDRTAYLPSGGLSSLQYDINFSTQPNNYIIYREEIRGATKPAA
ncbi:MAG: hypothetical protein A2167_05435 [Planctomycetes bacterium RBG_13_46_10]|nr:MAG: hypothetical protein A2167_05435 [Planctomycetes bacterium RBG_13_46_10]